MTKPEDVTQEALADVAELSFASAAAFRAYVDGPPTFSISPDAIDDLMTPTDPSSQAAAERQIIQQKFRRINDALGVVRQPTDLTTIAAVYIDLRLQSAHIENPQGAVFGPGVIVGKGLKRAALLLEQPHSGTADPDEIAAFIAPAVETLLSHQGLCSLYETFETRQKSKVEQHVARALASVPEGTAERLAGIRLIRDLADRGRYDFSRSGVSGGIAGKGERYITAQALAYLNGQGVGQGTLPDGAKALELMDEIVRSVIDEQAVQGDTPYVKAMADELRKAYKMLREKTPTTGSQGQFPVTATIKIANELGPKLVDLVRTSRKVKSFSLPQYGEQDFSRLPGAFGRLLYAMGDSLLRRATETNLYGGDILRCQMVYVEALAQRWSQGNYESRLAVGDIALQHLVRGDSAAVVSAMISAAMEEKPVFRAPKRQWVAAQFK